MTQPNGRPVTVVGREIRVKSLTDMQRLHMLRHARILQKEGLDVEVKIESAERMSAILATVVIDPDDRAYLTQMEEEGKVELRDLLGFVSEGDDLDAEPEKPKVRRGRPPKRLVA